MPTEDRVEDIMTKDVLMIDADSSALVAARIISPLGYLIIMKGVRATGIVTEHDIVLKVTANGTDPSKLCVRDIMSTPVISVTSDASVEDAAEMMTECKIRRLAVTKGDGTFVGVVTLEDLARVLAKDSNYQDPALNALARIRANVSPGPYQ